MEWVDGEPLSSVRRAAAKQGNIPRSIAVKIMADAAAGLHAAHELRDELGNPVGLVHRDISPQNILLAYDGAVKIVDFGVAKAAGRTTEETSAGQIKGKPPYMSPEQALGKPIDRRTDVFALGIILYQLTTGKHPFRGETDIVTLQNIVSERPIVPPRAYDKEYPKTLETVVLKALERDVEQRYQTAAELEAALDHVYAPSEPRVRTEDVGKFVRSLLGARADERRNALRDAIRQADERAQGEPGMKSDPQATAVGTYVGLTSIQHPTATVRGSEHSTPTGNLSTMPIDRGGADALATQMPFGAGIDGAAVGPSFAPTPFGTQLPSDPDGLKRSSGAFWVVGAIAFAAAVIGTAVLLTTMIGASNGSKAAAERQPSMVGPVPVAVEPQKPSTPPLAQSAIAVGPSELAVDQTTPNAASAKTASKTSTTHSSDSKKTEAKKNATKTAKSGGFVPPPVTDPGF
jgi:serine/threonine-protein kinase